VHQVTDEAVFDNSMPSITVLTLAFDPTAHRCTGGSLLPTL